MSDYTPKVNDSSLPTASQASTTAAAVKRNPLVPAIIALLAIIAILTIMMVVIVTKQSADTSSASGNSTTSQETSTGAPTDADSQTQSEGTSATDPENNPEFAPSITNPQGLSFIHAQYTRDPNDGQAIGDVDAPVVMALFSDFACPYCTLFATEVQPALQKFIDDGTLRIEWKDLAQISPTSPLAAQAGRAAAAQGKFWEFEKVVYAAAEPGGHPEYTEDSLVAFATEAGVADIEKFRADMNSAETIAAIEEARNNAYSIGIQGTPFAFVGDAVIGGYQSADYVVRTVVEQAKFAKAQ